jgi:general secretion pathway protein D
VSDGTVRTLSDNITQVVDIKNRNLDTVLTLKDGETSIIGGLLQRRDSDTRNKPSIVGDIPVIGRLLTHKETSNKKTELVLALTPHLVRGITVPDEEVSSFWSGKEDDPSVTNPYGSFVEEPEIAAPQPGAPQAPLPGAPAPQTPVTPPFPTGELPQAVPFPPVSGETPPQAPPPALLPGATVPQPPVAPPLPPGVSPQAVPLPPVSGGAPPRAAQPGANRQVAASGPRTRVSLYFGAPSSVNAGQRFNVTVTASNATGLYNAPFVLSYDPLLVDYSGASEGDFLKREGRQTLFQASGVRNSGQVRVGLGMTGDTTGVNGSGILAVFSFTAKAAGPARFGFLSSAFTDGGGNPIDVTPSNAVVEVKQPGGAPAAK